MEALLILLLFPLAWPFIAKRIWHNSINWTEMTIQIVGVCVLVVATWQLGVYGQTSDTEIWNGQIVSKDRDHGHYVRSYDCNCRQSCSGSGSSRSCHQVCSTCYEDHYTVTWTANTTAGNLQFDHKDSTWKSVYNSPDPAPYTNCKKGQPASREHSYTNYVQAVPESLFNDDSELNTYADKVPAYPRVYNFYKIDRVLQVGTGYKYAATLNDQLNDALKTLGPLKQANIIVILTDIADPSYRFAVERAWLGGEKNDIIVFLGLDKDTIIWADVMTWALNEGNELFHVTLRDELVALGTVEDVNAVSSAVVNNVKGLYDRPNMSDYEYLKDEISPPTWVIILAIFFAIGGSLGLTFVFHRYEVDDFIGELFKRNRRYR